MFVEKLNKKQEGVYVIEEEKTIVDGIWEGYLDHDNANRESIYIYTGPKLTGDRVENYFVSTPSETPWKTHLKVFSKSEKIYITYETTGDQVEAEDINFLQDVLVDEIERAKSEEDRIDKKLDDEIARAITEDERLDVEVNKKANKTYVDTELNKRYTKDEVFNKQEVLQKIQDLIGTAPEALDTLEELARALDNDPNFATNVINLLATKVDKVAGKGLSTNDYTDEEKQKLAGIEDGANRYVHPNTHPASMIVETSSKRFVSDEEKNKWNNKWDFDEEIIKNIKVKKAIDADTVNGKAVESNVPPNAKFTDTTYSEISTSEIDAGTSSTLRTISGRRVKYILDKVSTMILTAISNLTKADIGLGNVDNVKQATKVEFDAHNNDSTRHITSDERNKWNNKANKSDIPTKVSQLENDENYVTQEELGDAGYGDMSKGVYDKNNDGKVDKAELADKVPWTGVTSKPSTFPPSSHTHSISNVTGLQNALDNKMGKGPVTWNDLKGV